MNNKEYNLINKITEAFFGTKLSRREESVDDKYANISPDNEDYFDHSEAKEEREANKEIANSKWY